MTRHVPETFVGTLMIPLLIEQPVAEPLVTLYVMAPLPFPPDVTSVMVVLIGVSMVVMTSGDDGAERVELAIVYTNVDEVEVAYLALPE